MARQLIRPAVLVMLMSGTLAVTLNSGASAQYYPLPQPPREPPPRETPPPPLIQPVDFLAPFPIVRIAGRLTSTGARIRVLAVRAPTRTTILVRCYRRECRRRSLRRGRGINRAVRFRRFERSYQAGTYIEVRVRRSGTIGKLTRFRVRRGRRPARRDLCLLPGDSRGSVCPER